MFLISPLQLVLGQKEYHSVDEIEREWKEYTSFQREELLSFCDFLFQEGYYERTVLACFRYTFLYPEDEIIPLVYYKIARSYEEMGNLALAEEYYQQVLSNVLPNSSEYRAAHYRLTYLSLQQGDYESVHRAQLGDSLDPYLVVFDGYALFMELQWEQAKANFQLCRKLFDTREHDRLLRRLIRACEEVSSLPVKNRKLAGLISIFPGGGRAYLRDWSPAAGTFISSVGLGLRLIDKNWRYITLATYVAIYSGSIWGSIKDVDYANQQTIKKYAKWVDRRFGPGNFIDFPEPEILSFH
ncbi:MAG: tol-pal system YbgF family protein [Fidelibacterota bacterium]